MQETKSGCDVITQKPNSCSFSGKAHHCYVHKKQGKSDQTSRGCWWLILTGGGGIYHQELVPPGQTINQHYYWEGLQCLWWQVSWRHLARLQIKDWLICYDNVLVDSRQSWNIWCVKIWVWSTTLLVCLIWFLMVSSCFWERNHSPAVLQGVPLTEKQTTLKGTMMTNNKGKCIFQGDSVKELLDILSYVYMYHQRKRTPSQSKVHLIY